MLLIRLKSIINYILNSFYNTFDIILTIILVNVYNTYFSTIKYISIIVTWIIIKMKMSIARSIIYLLGWKIIDNRNKEKNANRSIVLGYPHCYLKDSFISMLVSIGYNNNNGIYLIKDKYNFFPISLLIKFTGGIPIKVDSNNSTVNTISNKLNTIEKWELGIYPEGSRDKGTKSIKSGFYYIAKNTSAKLNIVFIDYRKKQYIINDVGDIDENIENTVEKISKILLEESNGSFGKNFKLKDK